MRREIRAVFMVGIGLRFENPGAREKLQAFARVGPSGLARRQLGGQPGGAAELSSAIRETRSEQARAMRPRSIKGPAWPQVPGERPTGQCGGEGRRRGGKNIEHLPAERDGGKQQQGEAEGNEDGFHGMRDGPMKTSSGHDSPSAM